MGRFSASLGLVLGVALAAGCGGQLRGEVSADGTGQLLETPAVRVGALDSLRDECGATSAAPMAGTILRAPYIQQVTDRSAQVLWTASDAEAAVVDVRRPDGTLIASVPAVQEETRFLNVGAQLRADLIELEPASTYCYEVRSTSTGATLVERTGFRTAPGSSSDEAIRFIAFGDSGSGYEDQLAVREQMGTVRSDLMIHTGDVAYENGHLSQLETKYFDVYDPLFRSTPSYPVAGNHDYETRNAAPLREALSLPENGGEAGRERWYSFDYGPAHFVALDTQRLGDEQLAWLEADLEANDQRWTFAYMHHPAFSSGDHGGSGTVRREVLPILERHGVDVVFGGHDHHYERTEPIDGIVHIVTGGGGRGVRPPGDSDFTAFAEGVLHFVYVTIEGDVLRLHAIDAVGREFDGVELRKQG